MRRTNMPKTFWFPKRRAKVPIFCRRPWRIPSSRRQKRRQTLPLFPNLFVWKDGEGYCCRLLLNNGEQLVAKKADAALDWIIARVGGTALQDGSGWFRFRLEDGLNSLGRIRCYWDKDEELRVLICMPNSGAILDYASFDVEIGEVLQPGHYYSTRFLNFMLNGLDNLQSNQTLSQKELNDDLTP